MKERQAFKSYVEMRRVQTEEEELYIVCARERFGPPSAADGNEKTDFE